MIKFLTDGSIVCDTVDEAVAVSRAIVSQKATINVGSSCKGHQVWHWACSACPRHGTRYGCEEKRIAVRYWKRHAKRSKHDAFAKIVLTTAWDDRW